jgi:hypothetical protein
VKFRKIRTLSTIAFTALLIIASLNIHPTSAATTCTGCALRIVTPSNSTYVRTSFVVNFEVTAFKIVQPELGVPANPNEGHLAALLDGKNYTEWASADGIPFTNIQPGNHTVFLRLEDDNYHAFSPDINSTVNIIVSDSPSGTPSLTILSPAGALNPSTTVNSSFVVTFIVTNFLLVQPNGQPNALNYGHIHVIVDGKYWSIWASPNGISLTLPAGQHTITLELHNNDHSPVLNASGQPIMKSITITVVDTSTAATNSANAAYDWALAATVVSAVGLITSLYILTKVRKIK